MKKFVKHICRRLFVSLEFAFYQFVVSLKGELRTKPHVVGSELANQFLVANKVLVLRKVRCWLPFIWYAIRLQLFVKVNLYIYQHHELRHYQIHIKLFNDRLVDYAFFRHTFVLRFTKLFFRIERICGS